MINTTSDEVCFNLDGPALDLAAREAMRLAANSILTARGLEDIDLTQVTTKTNLLAAYPKFVDLCALNQPLGSFNEDYIRLAYECYRDSRARISEEHFRAIFFPSEIPSLQFRPSYASAVKPGIGQFLLALHSAGAITLPASFRWPTSRIFEAENPIGKRQEIGKLVCSELLRFIRQLDSQSDVLPHPAFGSIGTTRKRREWFLTYGTKLLVATGWHSPEDANLLDLLAIKHAEKSISAKDSTPLAFKALVDVLIQAYGNRIKFTMADWNHAVRSEARGIGLDSTPASGPKERTAQSDRDVLEESLLVEPLWGRINVVSELIRLPGLAIDFQSIASQWTQLEKLFIEKTPRENYKVILNALAWWNIYLLNYLPHWFDRHPDTKLIFPKTPSLLIKNVFVSRLLPPREEWPVTFMTFMNEQSARRKWENNSYYAILVQLESFFAFLERYSDELPECLGFRQPLERGDYPRTSRARRTSKHPVPRRYFSVFLDYYEAILAHHYIVTQRVLSGEITEEALRKLTWNATVIDTLASSELVGFVPLLFTKRKTIRLQFIPNVLDPGLRTTKDGRRLYLPHPHALHQNLSSLHTGLRHNHIQWLDRDLFDSLCEDDHVDFTLLVVNTDKQKKEPWTPNVNIRVVELLRAQRRWSEVIGEPGINAQHYYNNNPKTKWRKLRPLFAYLEDGRPHDDNVYLSAWRDMLCGLQGLMGELSEYGPPLKLLSLLPPGHRPDDPELASKLVAYGSQIEGDVCPLNVMTKITPHSARVSVVSQYITFLPVDLIGKYITGQSPGVVSYYVHLEREVVQAEQVSQAARMRDAALRNAFEPIISGNSQAGSFIHPDKVNSNLARALKTNVQEAVIRFGCMSISFNEDSMKGIDVLLESQGVDAVGNKTEICPYGNNCPPHVVKQLRGYRRCGLCSFAVRSVDHLPAIAAKMRQVAEMVDEIEGVLSEDDQLPISKFTAVELDGLEERRAQLCEELTGWILSQEVLEHTRQRLIRGDDTKAWAVPAPEILERSIRRVSAPTSMTEYLLTRLGECVAYPTLESPQIRARFDLLRRELLARAGDLKSAFSSATPVNPAAEVAGALKSLISASGISASEMASILENDSHLEGLISAPQRLLTAEE
jgi:hypothetical protein